MEKSPQKSLIQESNWATSYYQNEQLRAMISFGGAPGTSGDVNYFYGLVVLQDPDKESAQEIFCQYFNSLNEVLSTINERYGHWEWVDAISSKDSSSCGSCQAH